MWTDERVIFFSVGQSLCPRLHAPNKLQPFTHVVTAEGALAIAHRDVTPAHSTHHVGAARGDEPSIKALDWPSAATRVAEANRTHQGAIVKPTRELDWIVQAPLTGHQLPRVCRGRGRPRLGPGPATPGRGRGRRGKVTLRPPRHRGVEGVGVEPRDDDARWQRWRRDAYEARLCRRL